MAPLLDIRTLAKGRLVRAVALLFLLHAGVDLAFPQLCSEEPIAVVTNQSQDVADYLSESLSAFQASKESSQDQHPQDRPSEEDCFCCCAHVMPSPPFVNPGAADLNLGRDVLPDLSVPAAALNPPYHPPRFA